jgi:diguanylate cyclase (GGDEF)-like protein
MLKRHEIEILLKAGHSKAEAARLAGISLRSVNRIAAEAPVVHVDDAAEREKRRIGRPSKVEDFRKPVIKILVEKPDLPSLEILRRVREAGYQGGKTAATHDALTSIWNRGVIMELLGHELARSRREGKCMAILLGDLDHIKRVNDTYGHRAGDEVLKETARRLLSAVRSYDFVGRYGGEEFLVVLNNCDPAGGLTRAEDIRKSIAQRPVQTSGGLVHVTMSVGLLLSKEWGFRPVEELLQEADAALYAAKEAGRNCVKVATPKIQPDAVDTLVPELARRRR